MAWWYEIPEPALDPPEGERWCRRSSRREEPEYDRAERELAREEQKR